MENDNYYPWSEEMYAVCEGLQRAFEKHFRIFKVTNTGLCDQDMDDVLTFFKKKDFSSFWRLDLSRNAFEGLPHELRLFRDAKLLDLSHNLIQEIRPTSLPLLTLLNLQGNQLTSIPLDLLLMPALRSLNLSFNFLTYLPRALPGKLKASNIRHLNLSNNVALQFLPRSLSEMQELEILECNDCALIDIPRALLTRGLTKLELENNYWVQYVPIRVSGKSVLSLKELCCRVLYTNDNMQEWKQMVPHDISQFVFGLWRCEVCDQIIFPNNRWRCSQVYRINETNIVASMETCSKRCSNAAPVK